MDGSKSLIYQILKTIEEGKEPVLENLEGVTIGGFHSALEQIAENKLASNISFSLSGKGKKAVRVANISGSKLTAQGVNYIHVQDSRSY
ncbi:hypothetical protein MKZ24_11735 [Paenibacillus sp. FSL R7-0297]|uniref:hypothetical protein n=1 Tax=unclassified Paenibacillus TaxID=185978 RepID=UPI0004F676FA|nr:hypothetical protein [Paenibacillus sp. FSL R5-0912]AIQ43289.1 hypothetical protein R50912_27155 [Paenibacillus sp. FSL R5-0912]